MTNDATEIALAFMRLTPTSREQLAKELLVYNNGLPENSREAALEIICRVKENNLVEDLARLLGLRSNIAPCGTHSGNEDGCLACIRLKRKR